jgi:hypothetical protein
LRRPVGSQRYLICAMQCKRDASTKHNSVGCPGKSAAVRVGRTPRSPFIRSCSGRANTTNKWRLS